MDDSPSIAPDLTELIALCKQYSTNRDPWETETLITKIRDEEQAISARAPHRTFEAHAIAEGTFYLRRQSDSGRQRGGEHKERNFRMAAECIARRANPDNDDTSDIRLMKRVGALPGYDSLSKSQARAAILEGLRDPRNQERIKEFGNRGNPNRRPSIFDGTRKCP